MPSIFDSKYFNGEVFGRYVETVPRVKQNAFLRAGILRPRPDLASRLVDQTGGNFITVPMIGRIGGSPVNYDGNTTITTDGIGTFMQSMIVIGRAKGWKEKDFTYDITGNDFMANIGAQVGDYWDDEYQRLMLLILEGIFGVTADNFNTKHTLDITGEGNGRVAETTLLDVTQQAFGANASLASLVIMHSQVATTLKKLEVLEYRKQTDAEGIQREIALADWNGRTVYIDDDVPTEEVTDGSETYTKYTTYVFGQGAFDYLDAGAKNPYTTDRVEDEDGGVDRLWSRRRVMFAPHGFSFVQPTVPIISPDDTQLSTAARWTIVKNADNNKYYDSKAIPFARIISKG